MTDHIERDALTDDTRVTNPIVPHDHAAKMHTFIATPRATPTVLERLTRLFKSSLKPGNTIVQGKDGRRYMFIITSNSYEDRENETITSKALQEYEDSCYPGEGLYHNDNPLLWWHDDDVVMGDIVAVNYAEPFLIEIAREAPTRLAKGLWDYAEKQGDAAAASHRFGYYENARSNEGVFDSIIKLETSYLPERDLAANGMTYAGVIGMSSKQADARLNEIFSAATGGKVTDIASAVHKNAKEAESILAGAGLSHKAKKADGQEDVEQLDETVAEDAPIDEKETALPGDFATTLEKLMMIYQLMMNMQGDMNGMSEEVVEMAKALVTVKKSVDDGAAKRKSFEDTLSARVKALEDAAREKPKSVQRDMPATDILRMLNSLGEANKEASESVEGVTDNPLFGKHWKTESPYGANGK